MHVLRHSSMCTSYVIGGENLLKYQDILFLVIISCILVTCMFEQVVISVRRNWMLVTNW